MALTVLSQTIEAAGVGATVVTEVIQADDGSYVREFRFYGEGTTVGGDGPLLLTVRAKASEEATLRFQTGSLSI